MNVNSSTRTSSEIARRFAGSDDPAAIGRIARRLENWGNIGLLTPVGKRHTGRGRARAYDEHEQIKAAALLLAFAYQTPKAVLALVSRLFDDIRGASEAVSATGVRRRSKRTKAQRQKLAGLLNRAKTGDTIYLILEPGELDELPRTVFGDSLKPLEERDSGVVVNITRAIKRVL